jgi:DNA-binding LytR/AlgR family response regulator
MHTFIIDDEPKAIKIVESYIEKTAFIELKGAFRDPIEAMNAVLTDRPDLIFLDINMPGLTGIQMLKSLKNPPMVIFTTAYSEYAISGYELDVVDYLLKPISFERFLKAATKAKELFALKHNVPVKPAVASNLSSNEAIFIKSGSITHRVEIDQILFLEAMGNYVNFVLNNKKICSYTSLQEAIDLLPAQRFIRIHKSFVVACKHVETIEVHQVKVGKYTLPVGKSYRDGFNYLKR